MMWFWPDLRFHSIILFLYLSGLIFSSNTVYAQKDPLKASYINQYSDLAVSEMRRSGIPASITMAQAILESDIGRSELATIANNHFGIKCHLEWEGKRFYYDDDEKHECFRFYKDPADSFYDHSIFLLTRDRYKVLFELDPMDYKAWAKGLKEAGYATNPGYAEILIRIIEEENLTHLDNGILRAVSRNSTSDGRVTGPPNQIYQPLESSQLPYHNRTG